MLANAPPVVGTNAPYVQLEAVNLLDWGELRIRGVCLQCEDGWSKCLLLLLPQALECHWRSDKQPPVPSWLCRFSFKIIRDLSSQRFSFPPVSSFSRHGCSSDPSQHRRPGVSAYEHFAHRLNRSNKDLSMFGAKGSAHILLWRNVRQPVSG